MDRVRCDGMRALVAATVLLLGNSARADVVGPPTLQCPAGFSVQRCHGSEYCGFTTCTTDAQCGGGTCADRRWCINEFYCGRWRPDGPLPMTTTYEGSCANGEGCKAGTCKTVRACAPKTVQGDRAQPGSDRAQPSGDGAQPPGRGCTCGVAEAGAGRAPLWALLAAGFLLGWRRARAR